MKGFHILVITYILVINDKTCPREARAGPQGGGAPLRLKKGKAFFGVLRGGAPST
jgi:hypothetical protein